MLSVRLRNIRGVRVILVSLVACVVLACAQSAETQQAPSGETGYAAKRPVFGASGPTAGWGAIATVVKEAMASHGWDIQICRSCAGAARAARLVAAAAVPPRPGPDSDEPPPPNGPLDLGATGAEFLWWAYQGTNAFAADPEGPRTQLRLVANIQTPSYLLIAVEADSGITDLAQINERNLSVQINVHGQSRGVAPVILDYYGLTGEGSNVFRLTAEGIVAGGEAPNVIIGYGSPSGHYPSWRELDQKLDLRYLEVPGELRAELVRDFDLEERSIPVGLFRGIGQAVPSVGRTGTAIYGRDDMPDDFAYTLAQAMDEEQHLLQWVNVDYSYNPYTAWKAFGVPLHPGAERYYRERGYMQ